MMKSILFVVIIVSVIALMLRRVSCVNRSSEFYRTCSSEENLLISDQSQLNMFFTNTSLYDNRTKCIQLLFIGNSFNVNLLQLMRINLGTNGSLAIMGGDSGVNINCAINVTDPEELREMLQPISRALFVLFDGLVFTQCPVPIVIEEVYNVVILNCVFL